MSLRSRDDIIFLAEIDSTNLYCLRRAAELPSGSVVIADRQTAGRGRQGRTWQSPPGVNLYFSMLLKAPLPNAAQALYGQVAALATATTLRDFGVEGAWIKWPNDIVANGAKIAGVLCQGSARRGAPDVVVVGIGVNLNMAAADLAVIDQPATSLLAITGETVDRSEFLTVLLRCFNGLYQTAQQSGREQLHRQWRAASRLPGRPVRILTGDGSIIGTVIDLEVDGALRLRLPDGAEQVFHSGEVSLRGLT